MQLSVMSIVIAIVVLFARKAVTVKARQNIIDADLLSSCSTDSLQNSYDNCKRAIQASTHKRAIRCSRKSFEDRLCRCSAKFDPGVLVPGEDDVLWENHHIV